MLINKIFNEVIDLDKCSVVIKKFRF